MSLHLKFCPPTRDPIVMSSSRDLPVSGILISFLSKTSLSALYLLIRALSSGVRETFADNSNFTPPNIPDAWFRASFKVIFFS